MRRDFLKICAVSLPSVSLLSACGGKSGNGNATLRLANATRGIGALDVLLGTSAVIGSTPEGSVSSAATIEATSASAQVRQAGGSTLATRGITPAKDVAYTLVAYNYGGAVSTIVLSDTATAPAAGYSSVRVFNAGSTTGAVDVYMLDVSATPAATALGSASPTFSGLAGSTLTSYMQLTPKRYRVLVTGAGNRNDLRLDTTVEVADQKVSTLLLSPTAGGVLVNLDRLDQGGALTPSTNTGMRVRVVANVSGNATVTATSSAGTIASMQSPNVTDYMVVPAGLSGLAIAVNGTPVSIPAFSAAAGSDVTLLVVGTSAANARVIPLRDDNAPPTTANTAAVRLVHAVNGLEATTLTLTASYLGVATNIAFGNASGAMPVPTAQALRLDVTTPLNPVPIATLENVPLAAGKVYTVFMLGDSGAAVPMVRNDR